jgi:electron transfer flavoprotein alpha subunit
VDAGWIEAERQIGLTGKFVSPQLYIAVGISGAPQHMTGCANAKTIVCVNSNPEAAIFKRAHYGIVGDFRLIIPKIIPEFQKILAH